MKRYILLVMVVLVMVGLTASFGCVDVLNSKVSDKVDDKMIESVNLFNPNMPYSLRGSMSLVIKKNYVEESLGKADITRRLDTKTYEIRKGDDGSFVVVVYDNETGRLIDVWRLDKLYERNDFDRLVNGVSSLEDVVLIDPYTKVFEKSNSEGVSEHRLINDEIVIIDYKLVDDYWQVEKVGFEKDPLGFSSLISQDYSEIKNSRCEF
ncbi:MAG: hypothetical protein PHQ32_05840 [Firmicutes bacterium]|nr:hypothetical protein [Bacillota bacterium]